MITLDNFESSVPFKILMRGIDYYESGSVTELAETTPGEWEATVEGTEEYNIEISLDGTEVESWYCDCPYDGGSICKHVVATLMAIRDNQEKAQRSAFSNKKVIQPKDIPTISDSDKIDIDSDKIVSDTIVSDAIVKDSIVPDSNKIISDSDKIIEYILPEGSVDLQQLLTFVLPEQLKRFVCDYASKNLDFKKELLESVVVKYLNLSVSPKEYRIDIQKVFNCTKLYVKQGRYSRYDDLELDWTLIFDKVDSFLEKADLLLKIDKLEEAIAILLQVLRSIGENYDDALIDEDDIYVSDYCEQVGNKILDVVQHPKVSEMQKKNILQEIREIAKLSTYKDYNIFDVDDLIMNINISVQSADEAIKQIDNLLEERKYYFDLYKLVFRKIELLNNSGEHKKAEDVIRQYLHLPEIRRSEIERLILDGKYDEAIRLADEGIELIQRECCLGTEGEWLRLKLKIYEISDNTPELINTYRQLFILNNGNLEYYRKLKTLVPSEQWKTFFDEMMGATKFSESFFYSGNVQADIYVEEKEYDRLFQLLSSTKYDQLNALRKYASHLKNSHSEQLITMFIANLKDYAENHLGRTHYENIAHALLCMRSLNGGKAAVNRLVEEFRIKYKRRAAMMEVLGGF